MTNQTVLETLETYIGKSKVMADKDIAAYITLRTPTRAQYYTEVRSRDELIRAIRAAHDAHIPVFMLGGGSNIAVLRPTIEGLVIRNQYNKKEVIREDDESVDLLLSSGYPMGLLVRETVTAGYEGFEYHLGLPGTIGGAIFMNSKWTRPYSYVGDNLISAVIVDANGMEKQVHKNYFQFAYDYSILQKTHEIILEAVFRLRKLDPTTLKERADAALAYRKQTQPFGVATSGCFFRNISESDKHKHNLPTTSAGYLVDKAGCKGLSKGGFKVSEVHANFLVNAGKGTSEDLVQLVQEIKQKVATRFGVHLEEEVILVD